MVYIPPDPPQGVRVNANQLVILGEFSGDDTIDIGNFRK